MPKRATKRPTQRSVPYELRPSTKMATAIAAPMPAWPASQQTAGMGWSDPHMQYHHPPPMSTSNFYMAQSMRPPPAMRAPMTPHEPLPKPGQSSPWTTEEDNLLVEAKSQGLAWEEIHKRHFPNKSGNACRKRHERVMAKLRETDWDEARIRRVISQYNRPGVRESIWRPLSDLVGEKWEDVEKVVCHDGPSPDPTWLRKLTVCSVTNKG